MRFPLIGRWEDAQTGIVLVGRLHEAESYIQRFRGLQFARSLDPDCGLLLRNCRSVHTLCMRFSIDLFFLSADWEIHEVWTDVKPWRIVIPRPKQIAHVIELAAGHDRNITTGMKTRFTANDYVSQ
jgi:uncharacterized membrane protein (UPF0127 family)